MNSRKKHFLLAVIFILSFLNCPLLYSQNQISGRVIDFNTGMPIAHAKISTLNSLELAISDWDGNFSIEFRSDLVVEANGYLSKQIKVEEEAVFLLIQLEEDYRQLEEVTITALSLGYNKTNSVQAISQISSQELQLYNSSFYNSILNTLPGVFMQSGTLNTSRISIRGIGARSLFGTANIRAYFGDIPLTDGNGESAIEDLELSSLAGISVIKGPSASTFGVGLGGTILLQPNFGNGQSTKLSSSFEAGSFGYQKYLANTSFSLDDARFNVLYSSTLSDGFRENNSYDRKTLTLTSRWTLDAKNSLTLLASYVDLFGGIPSSLDRDDFEESPERAAFVWGRAEAYEDSQALILGLSWRHYFEQSGSWVSSIFLNSKTNEEPRPFNILEEATQGMGLRSRYENHIDLLQKRFNYSFGLEGFYDRYKPKTFENLYASFPPGTGSVKGEMLTNLREKRYYINLFAEGRWSVSEATEVVLGLNVNKTEYQLRDLQNSVDDYPNRYSFDLLVSPKIGIVSKLSESFRLFGNISHGYSNPTTAETLLPEGVFNPDLNPEVGWNFEIGSRFQWKNYLKAELSLYHMKVTNSLVSRRTIDDNFYAINAGKARYNGLELSLSSTLWKNANTQLQFLGALSLNDYEFTDFVDADNDFSGNRVTGTPNHMYNLQLQLLNYSGFYGRLSYNHIGDMPVNDANQFFSDSYGLVDAKLGFKTTLFNQLFLNVYGGINNALDKAYASQLQINALGFGTNLPRFYYPGNPRNWYAGIHLTYQAGL
ncbi:TonB-dependent receptor domain-containing protein [Aegicerativicinus sediminis]|uniref:TonB-dependent receptor domain-containing protein n=1 Tax=Aegicerativicinus sediminis TaxID=2893202 RepID=UPI001E402DA6|nr:TonB-dependent receptor [Aegicerativicinus sediminis]